MALYYNSNNVPQSNNVYYNSNASNKVYHNNNLVWQKQKTIYPGVPVANTQNLGYAAYFTVTNSGSDIKVDAFGGTERGYGRVMLGGFSTIGYSQI
ncbi:hypothetical protein, partial [Ruthenibacterium lactatiformans]